MDLSVVAPARNEEANIAPLAREVARALEGIEYELIVVDDGSADGTRRVACDAAAEDPRVRVVVPNGASPGRGVGQTAAMGVGILASRGTLVATIDADLQNDPADLPGMIAELRRTGASLVQGDRSKSRKDSDVRRFGSAVGRVFREALLGDTTRDTGCSLRVMTRDLARRLPLEVHGMHRFIPALARDLGARVVEMPVSHRARTAGATKYGLGLSRALPGLVDLLAVRYLRGRRRSLEWTEASAGEAHR